MISNTILSMLYQFYINIDQIFLCLPKGCISPFEPVYNPIDII